MVMMLLCLLQVLMHSEFVFMHSEFVFMNLLCQFVFMNLFCLNFVMLELNRT